VDGSPYRLFIDDVGRRVTAVILDGLPDRPVIPTAYVADIPDFHRTTLTYNTHTIKMSAINENIISGIITVLITRHSSVSILSILPSLYCIKFTETPRPLLCALAQ
jgi:hypothetical protein